MRIKQRILSLLLAGALLLPALPGAEAAERTGTENESISATLRVDWPQNLEEHQNREVRAELFQGGRSQGTLSMTEEDGQARLGE